MSAWSGFFSGLGGAELATCTSLLGISSFNTIWVSVWGGLFLGLGGAGLATCTSLLGISSFNTIWVSAWSGFVPAWVVRGGHLHLTARHFFVQHDLGVRWGAALSPAWVVRGLPLAPHCSAFLRSTRSGCP